MFTWEVLIGNEEVKKVLEEMKENYMEDSWFINDKGKIDFVKRKEI